MDVYDGDDMNAPMIARLTGILPSAVMSTGRDIFINFLSDISLTKLGFRIEFNAGKNI